jgi:hypothetical protein
MLDFANFQESKEFSCSKSEDFLASVTIIFVTFFNLFMREQISRREVIQSLLLSFDPKDFVGDTKVLCLRSNSKVDDSIEFSSSSISCTNS